MQLSNKKIFEKRAVFHDFPPQIFINTVNWNFPKIIHFPLLLGNVHWQQWTTIGRSNLWGNFTKQEITTQTTTNHICCAERKSFRGKLPSCWQTRRIILRKTPAPILKQYLIPPTLSVTMEIYSLVSSSKNYHYNLKTFSQNFLPNYTHLLAK